MSETPDKVSGNRDSGNPPPPDDFGTRLSRARARREPKAGAPSSNLVGLAYRVVTELVAGVLIGAGIGWALDKWLGTSPWCLIGFFLLGTAAGFVNVMRAGGKLAETPRVNGKLPPAVPDDDEDDA